MIDLAEEIKPEEKVEEIKTEEKVEEKLEESVEENVDEIKKDGRAASIIGTSNLLKVVPRLKGAAGKRKKRKKDLLDLLDDDRYIFLRCYLGSVGAANIHLRMVSFFSLPCSSPCAAYLTPTIVHRVRMMRSHFH